MMKYRFLLMIVSLFFGHWLEAGIRFGSEKSSITAGENGILNIKSDKLYVDRGTVNKNAYGSIKGSPIYLESSYLTTGLSEAYLRGKFDPSYESEPVEGGIAQVGRVEFGSYAEKSDYILANPGGALFKVLAKPGFSLLRGQPLFFGKNDLEIADDNTLFALGIQNTLNSNIVLNGGVLYLQNDLSLGDDSTIVGDGQIVFNNRRISLGGTASKWTGNLIWNNALDLQMNSRVELSGKWAFFADCQVNGNSNVLDIANGGIILVYPNSRLRLTGVRLKGLGTGKIILAPNSELLLSDVEIEMNDNYDIYAGGIYIDGATTIVAKDKLLTFRSSTPDDYVLSMDDQYNLSFIKGLDSHGSLTIDRVALTYDPLEFVDQYNIRPLRINDPNHKFINIINHGSIRKFRMESISFLDYSSDTALQRYAVVFPVRPIKIYPEVINGQLNYEVKVQGNSNYYRFTEAHQPLMYISDNVHAVYENLLFSQFSAEYLSLGKESSLIFGNNTTVELFRNEDLNYTWTFQGNTIIRGGGSILNLGPKGAIVVQGAGSKLTIQGMTIKGIEAKKIRCTNDRAKIIFKDVKWIQSGNFEWARGAFDVLGDFSIIGPHTFSYTAWARSAILSDATMSLLRDAVFYYAPSYKLDVDLGSIIVVPVPEVVRDAKKPILVSPLSARNLLTMQDASSTLFMENATLSAPVPGLQLTNGRLELSKFNYLRNDGGIDSGTGIVFGDGNKDHNLIVDQPSSDALRTLSGMLVNQNVG